MGLLVERRRIKRLTTKTMTTTQTCTDTHTHTTLMSYAQEKRTLALIIKDTRLREQNVHPKRTLSNCLVL